MGKGADVSDELDWTLLSVFLLDAVFGVLVGALLGKLRLIHVFINEHLHLVSVPIGNS